MSLMVWSELLVRATRCTQLGEDLIPQLPPRPSLFGNRLINSCSSVGFAVSLCVPQTVPHLRGGFSGIGGFLWKQQ